MKILDRILKKIGGMSRCEMQDYTHDHCKEWQNPDGSSFPIKALDILLANGVDNDTAAYLLQQGVEQTQLKLMKQILV